ncbi:MAG: hypothetical protein AAF799_42725 [Myxococcota bacterium]
MRSYALGSIPVLLALTTLSQPAHAASEPSPPPEPELAPIAVDVAPVESNAEGELEAGLDADVVADAEVMVEEEGPSEEAVVAEAEESASVGPSAEVSPSTEAPVVVPPVLSPPAPTWGPVRPTPPPPPDPARTDRTMRKFRRGGIGILAVGGAGLALTAGLQAGRGAALKRCARTGDPLSDACVTSDVLERELSTYGALGLAALVTGSAGAGVMFGNAAATRDVERHGSLRSRSAARFAGIIAIGVASSVLLGTNIHFGRAEARCEGDPNCIARQRPLRWIANDGAALGLAAGAGLLGYSIAYDKQGKALMKLRAAPTMTPQQAGLSVTVAF